MRILQHICCFGDSDISTFPIMDLHIFLTRKCLTVMWNFQITPESLVLFLATESENIKKFVLLLKNYKILGLVLVLVGFKYCV